jgi:hypothetical protein
MIIGHPGRQQQRGHQVAIERRRSGQDHRVVGRALDAAVPGTVVVGAVAVVLAVGLVVLVVVCREVGEREAVVRGDEVDRGRGPTAVRPEEVADPASRVPSSCTPCPSSPWSWALESASQKVRRPSR